MPDTHASIRSADDRAMFHAALAETRREGKKVLDVVRESHARHLLTVQSLDIERRILREDFNHWNHENA